MARPQIDPQLKRNRKVTVKLNAQERQLLTDIANESGLSLYLVVRKKLFTGKFPQPKLAKVDMDTYRELHKIGVNLNQLTKFANSGLFPAGIRAVLLELKEQQQAIVKLLLG